MSDEKTEEPTHKKLQDAEEKGQAPKSQDLSAAATLGCITLCLMLMGGTIYDRLHAIGLQALHQGVAVRSNAELTATALAWSLDALMAVLPLIAVSIAAAVVASIGQTGVVLTFEPLEPKFDKLNPVEGTKKLFSVRSLVDLAKMLVKAVALGVVLWKIVNGLVPLAVGTAYLDVPAAAQVAWSSMLKLAFAATVVLAIIGPVDYGIQRWMFVRDNKMSKDEIKREHKESEGDPHLKGERKALAKEMATTPPEKRVPGATVVVTNPTHYAVALFYESGKTELPIVVAKGVDESAAHIRKLAEQHGVPIVGNPPLARALHKLRLDSPIPDELFEAVAQVLRWVMEIRAMNGSTS